MVEAKAPNANLTARQVEGEFISDGRQAFAFEGSDQYLRDTVREMRLSPSESSREIAEKLALALGDKKVDYIAVWTHPRTDGTGYFAVRTFKLK